MTAIGIVFLVSGALIFSKLFFLQIMEYTFYEALATGQHKIFRQLIPERGEILVQGEQGLFPLATNREKFLVYVVPKEIKDSQKVVDILAPWYKRAKMILQKAPEDEDEEAPPPAQEVSAEDTASDLDHEPNEKKEEEDEDIVYLRSRLGKEGDPYEPIIKGIDKELIAQLEALSLQGVYWMPLLSRFYPEKNIASHLLGFFSTLSDEKRGQYGIEGYWDEILRGKEGFLRSERDAQGSFISVAPRTIKKASDGADLVLTIDDAIEYVACSTLEKYVEKFEAAGGSVVVLDPLTGKVLALCGYPDFDPNQYNRVENIEVYNNPVIAFSYEPGSIFKPITMAAGLETGKVTPESTYYDEGQEEIAGFTIRNSDLKSYGNQTMTQVLEKSLNTGAIYVAREVGPRVFRKYLEAFGFGKKTDIKLAGEVSGDISSLKKKSFIYTATASFGQGIAVTPLQMANAFAVIANGGKLMRPYIVEKILYSDGREEVVQPQVIRNVISPRTATLLSGMLVSAVKNGYGKKADVEGFLVAGKTGTAQIAGPGGKYSQETIHSFAGFAPVDNPRFVILTKLDRPKVRFASDSAAPLFREIADFILKYYHVPPREARGEE